MPESRQSQAPGSPDGRPVETTHRGRLTRELIVQTALAVMDAEGLDAVTMRRVGRELGVEAMSLYNHVRDKEDLLDGISEAVMADFRWEASSGDWVAEGRAAAHEWRRLLKAHPNVMTVLAERKHPLTSPDSLRPTEIALGILRRAGLSERETIHAFQAIGGYIFGLVMMEVGNVGPGRPGQAGAEVSGELSASIASDFPCLAQMLPWLAECDMDATFEFGLDLLLEGIRSKTAAGGGSPAAHAPAAEIPAGTRLG
jgi:AcrR family transcriptional regulator